MAPFKVGKNCRTEKCTKNLHSSYKLNQKLKIYIVFLYWCVKSFSNYLVPRSGPPNPDTLPEDGKLKSETMVKDNRRYYLDLKENSRGRFLRVSQTIARGGPRCQIAIPAQGMIEFRDALQELLDEFGTDDGGYKGELPEGRHMRVENKNFYFDIGQNNRGIYMRISEVKTNFRTAITIPEKSWSRFRDIFADYVDKMKDGGEKGPSESNK
nr:transcriptional activator protein Pur-beta-like [Cherax quadricarinatus]